MGLVDEARANITAVVEYLNEHGAATDGEIADALEMNRSQVRNYRRLAEQEGLVGRAEQKVGDRGLRWQATTPTANLAAAEPDTGEASEVVDDAETRDRAVLSLLRASSGLSTKQVTQQLGLDDDQRNLAYASIRRLRDDGRVDRVDDGEGREAVWAVTIEDDPDSN